MKYLVCLLVFCSAAWAKPPQAPKPPQSPSPWVITDTTTSGPCGIPDCGCGCTQGRECVCRKTPTDELSKSYAADWQAQGWVWRPDLGYWTKPPVPTVQPTIYFAPQAFQPSFTPSFGGGGFRSGGGGRGGC